MRRVSIGSIAGMAAVVALVLLVAALPSMGIGQINNRFDRIAAALEAYAIDNNGVYPPTWNLGIYNALPISLTTPVTYLQRGDMIDPFARANDPVPFVRYINVENDIKDSSNPDLRALYSHLKARHGSWIIWSGTNVVTNPESGIAFDRYRYDPTNGTQSLNDPTFPMVYSFRSQRMKSETGIE